MIFLTILLHKTEVGLVIINVDYNPNMEENIHLSSFFAKYKAYGYTAGEIILRPDESVVNVYQIEKGYIKVYSITKDGEEKIHVVYKRGELFPLVWVFSNIVKPLYYEALGEVTLKKVPREEFLKFIQAGCSLGGYPFLFEVVNKIIATLDIHIDRVGNLGLTKAYPRLVARLLSLAKRFGTVKGDSVIINIPITHKDIANSINMTRETASRELEKLVRFGLIRFGSKRMLIITNIDRLKAELENPYESTRKEDIPAFNYQAFQTL